MQLSLVCVLFDPAIPTSFFNFIQSIVFILVIIIGSYTIKVHSDQVMHCKCTDIA